MTRRDYIHLSAALAKARPQNFQHIEVLRAWDACVYAVADVCKTENPAFNTERFVDACCAKVQS